MISNHIYIYTVICIVMLIFMFDVTQTRTNREVALQALALQKNGGSSSAAADRLLKSQAVEEIETEGPVESEARPDMDSKWQELQAALEELCQDQNFIVPMLAAVEKYGQGTGDRPLKFSKEFQEALLYC